MVFVRQTWKSPNPSSVLALSAVQLFPDSWHKACTPGKPVSLLLYILKASLRENAMVLSLLLITEK